MTNKQKLLIKTMSKIKASPEKWSLSRYKKTIVERWDDDYHVDLDIQRHPYFNYKTTTKSKIELRRQRRKLVEQTTKLTYLTVTCSS